MKKQHEKAGNPEEEKSRPIEKKEQVQQSNDEHKDQDFPGYPHAPATEEDIKKKIKTSR